MTLIIRPPALADKADWSRLWTGYLTFYESELSQAVYDVTFQRLIAGGDYEPQGRLALLEGAPVGLVHFFQHRHCWKEANVTYLQDLFVDPAARGKGVGKALIEAVYEVADASGAPTVYWMTTDDNPARALYDQVATRTNFVKYQR